MGIFDKLRTSTNTQLAPRPAMLVATITMIAADGEVDDTEIAILRESVHGTEPSEGRRDSMADRSRSQTPSHAARAALIALVAVGISACSGPAGTPSDAGMTDTSIDADITSDGSVIPVGCSGPADCDDDIDCTNDICGDSGACIHTPVPALCAVGSSCDPVTGCVAGIACASTADCADTNACTRDEVCNPASATCTFTILDNDGDGDPPRVCGGTDCDDSDRFVNAAIGEVCGNLVDDDCDGIVDTDATITSDPRLRNDPGNCGSCGNVCTGTNSCYQGSCIPCGGSPGAACCDLECTATDCDYTTGYCGANLHCDDVATTEAAPRAGP